VHGDKVEWKVVSGSAFCALPGIDVIDDTIEIWSHKFWETDEEFHIPLGVVDEIENRENWKKYKNSEYGYLVFLYEQIDEVAKKASKKYGVDLTFDPCSKPGYGLTFNIRDKSE